MKPAIIQELEDFFGFELNEVPFGSINGWKINAYSLNLQGEVIGLSVIGKEVKNISVLAKLPYLEVLSAPKNQIFDITSLRKLTNLQNLFLNDNQISDIRPLQNLTSLHYISIESNQISDITPLQNLINLKSIWMGYNLISSISPLQNLKNLKDLVLNDNQIFDITPLKELTNLRGVLLNNNQIFDITPLQNLANLQNLYFSDNKISTVTLNFLESFPKLEHIVLKENPITNLLPELIQEGDTQKILAYLREEEGAPLYEAKVLVLGEGNAGKTTLIRKLIDESCELENLPTTHGIDVYTYTFPDKTKNITYTANIWDFGGQAIYQSTHRFFLSNRAVYILLSDNRQEDTDFRYWLDKIKLFGKNSPLLIVQNEKDNRQKNLPTEVNVGEFPQLKQVLQVNFADNRGLADLAQAIQREFCALPHVHLPFPKRWREVRKAIEQKAEQESYVTYQTFRKICEQASITETNVQEQLCEHLHDLGVLLHFKNVDLLKKYVILSPSWATDAVYQLIDHVGKGKFSPAEAETVWANPENNHVFADMTHELLAMVQEFEICYAHEKIYVLPQLLSDEVPVYDWDNTNNLQLVYRYGFMPKGILWRLMVRLHYLLPDDNLVWKRGAIFHYEGAKAVVTETNDVYNREIRIKIAGKARKELWTIILNELNRINASYNFEVLAEEKRPQIEVPCNCSECKDAPTPYFYNYKKLKKRLEKNVFDVQCEESYEKVLVHGLIDEIQQAIDSKGQLTDAERRRVDAFLEKGNLPEALAILDRCEWESMYMSLYHKKKHEFIVPPQGKSVADLIQELRVLISTAFVRF